MDSKWIFQTNDGALFGQEGAFSLGWASRRRAKGMRVFCADLTERRLEDLTDIRPASWNPFDLVGAFGWKGTPVLSEPVRTYDLDDLKEALISQKERSLKRRGISQSKFAMEVQLASSFEEIYNLLQHNARQRPG